MRIHWPRSLLLTSLTEDSTKAKEQVKETRFLAPRQSLKAAKVFTTTIIHYQLLALEIDIYQQLMQVQF